MAGKLTPEQIKEKLEALEKELKAGGVEEYILMVPCEIEAAEFSARWKTVQVIQVRPRQAKGMMMNVLGLTSKASGVSVVQILDEMKKNWDALVPGSN